VQTSRQRSPLSAPSILGGLSLLLATTLGAQSASVANIADSPGGSAPAPEHVDNPFADATSYVNPDYKELVKGSIAKAKGARLKAKMRTVAKQPTGVWMDRMAAIAGGSANAGRLSLREHLDSALDQRRSGQPITFTLVVYDLPGRDCSADASNGELPLTPKGLQRYKTKYIDKIADVVADPKYADVRIVALIEPDGLPNLVTNESVPKCAEAKSSGVYVDGVRYALDKLHAVSNVYTYLDVAHAGWLGWDENLTKAVPVYTEMAKETEAGLDSVDGFVTNTSNYTPLAEPYLDDPEKMIGGNPIKSAKIYEYNASFDQADFTAAVYEKFTAAGWPADIGMLIDTGRSGWGGKDRPTEAQGDTVDKYVDSGRVDRRGHRGMWCNYDGAGIGEAPQASPEGYPESHLDAYVWVKGPGESDGSSKEIPNDEGKNADPKCDPTKVIPEYGDQLTHALPNAPLAGHWFHRQFAMLVRNAYPVIRGDAGR
jgi:cellulose 1,4-beta-cellobiosidase